MEVIVEYDYTAEESDELTIKKGDIIKDVSQFEEGWYIGSLNGRIGVFPDNFVKIKPSIQPKISPMVTTDSQKEPSENEVNNISSGEYENDNQPGSLTKPKPVCGIGLGNIFSGQPIQLKQTALKEVVKENESLSEKTIGNIKIADDNSQNYANQVRARYEYTPKQPDELELRVDDIIQVLDRNLPDDGWWKGRNLRTNLVGMFPDNFVAPMNGSVREMDENKLQFSTNASSLSNKNVSVKTITLQNANGSVNARSPRNSNSTVNTSQSSSIVSPSLDTGRNMNKSLSQIPSSKTPVVSNSGPPTHNQTNSSINMMTSGGPLSSATRSNSLGDSINSNQLTPGINPGLIQAGSNLVINNSKWRSNEKQDPYDVSKSRNEIHNGGDGDGVSVDNSNAQRLVGLTSDRPRQTGRRLPTKLSNATNPAPDMTNSTNVSSRNHNVTSVSNDMQVYDAPINRSSVTCLSDSQTNHEGSNGLIRLDQSANSSESTVKQQGRTNNHATNHTRTTNLQRSDGSNGSLELDRSTENVMNTSNLVVSNRNKGQSNDIQNQFDQFQNEVRQQLRDIRRECDSLKETHLQLRNDWIKGQKSLAERFQTLMDELDEIKKLRANDAVELTRFRTILMRLDANYLINSSNHITLDNAGAEEKLYDSENFLGISNASLSQRNVNFKTVSKDEVEEEDRRNDQNDNISPTDKHSLTTTQMSSQKSSIKPSLRPRPAPAYGIVSTSRR
ncbi:unnamed protein product [Trichobilharzia szidati]|nr:unnamed protein product [Trichobilharzia szidati]